MKYYCNAKSEKLFLSKNDSSHQAWMKQARIIIFSRSKSKAELKEIRNSNMGTHGRSAIAQAVMTNQHEQHYPIQPPLWSNAGIETNLWCIDITFINTRESVIVYANFQTNFVSFTCLLSDFLITYLELHWITYNLS